MIRNFALHRSHDAQVVDVPGDVRKQFTDRLAALAILAKPERRTKQHADSFALCGLKLVSNRLRQRLAVQFLDFRFWVKCVEL